MYMYLVFCTVIMVIGTSKSKLVDLLPRLGAGPPGFARLT